MRIPLLHRKPRRRGAHAKYKPRTREFDTCNTQTIAFKPRLLTVQERCDEISATADRAMSLRAAHDLARRRPDLLSPPQFTFPAGESQQTRDAADAHLYAKPTRRES